jgi:hypothetical protein
VRTAARHLVPEVASDDDWTAVDIAKLSLLRVLWLQKEVRRVSRHGNGDAAALLVRASIDATITGLYCLSGSDASERFTGATGKAVGKLLGDIGHDSLGFDLLDALTAEFGNGKVPVTAAMVDIIIRAGGPTGTRELYDRYYWPLSSFYVHTSPTSLLRHVHPRAHTSRIRPYQLWGKRSAVYTADTMVAVLAGAIAGQDHPDRVLFDTYGEAHWSVVLPPVAYLIRGLALTRLHLSRLPRVLVLVRRIRAERTACHPTSVNDVDELIAALGDLVGSGADPSFTLVKDKIREALLVPNANISPQ